MDCTRRQPWHPRHLDDESVTVSHLDLVLAGLGGQAVLVEVVEVGVEERLLGGDPLAGVVDQHHVEQLEAGRLQLLHRALQVHCGPVGERGLGAGAWLEHNTVPSSLSDHLSYPQVAKYSIFRIRRNPFHTR